MEPRELMEQVEAEKKALEKDVTALEKKVFNGESEATASKFDL